MARSKKIGAHRVVNGLRQTVDALCFLDQEVDLDSLVANGQQVAVVAEVEELFAVAGPLAGEVVGLVVAVEVDLVGSPAGLVALEKLLLDVWFPCCGEQGRQPVLTGEDLRETVPGFDRSRPTDERGTRQPPSQPVFFSPRNGVVPESGNRQTIGPLSVR